MRPAAIFQHSRYRFTLCLRRAVRITLLGGVGWRVPATPRRTFGLPRFDNRSLLDRLPGPGSLRAFFGIP